MKILFSYTPVSKGKPSNYFLISQNRFSKYRGNPELIYPLVPASGLTLLERDGHQVFYKDCIYEMWGELKFLEYLEFLKPDLLIFETKTPIIKYHWLLAKKIKDNFPELKLAVVGDHVSVLPRETLERSPIDFVITGGDFDISMHDLVNHMEGKGVFPKGIWYRNGSGDIENSGHFELIEDLDSLPFVNRDIIPWQHYHEAWRISDRFIYLMGSRGCPYHCTFCSWPQMFYRGRVRLRTPENIGAEMERLVKKYQVEEFFFDDDTFTFNRNWVLEVCSEIKSRNLKIFWSCNGKVNNVDVEMLLEMKSAGCRLIKYGVESCSQKTLDRIKKGYAVEDVKRAFAETRKAGILIHSTAMIGFPWETKDDIMRTIDFVRKLEPDTCQFSIPIAYPGTSLFEESKIKGWLAFGEEWEKYDMSSPALKHPVLSPGEIVRLCDYAWKRIYLSPKFVIRKLSRLRKVRDIKWLVRGFISLTIGHLKGLKIFK